MTIEQLVNDLEACANALGHDPTPHGIRTQFISALAAITEYEKARADELAKLQARVVQLEAKP